MDLEKLINSKEYREALGLPAAVTEEYVLLAQGEYNVNYLFEHPLTRRKLVLRINTGSQMHLDNQIEYETHALRLLLPGGRTPEVFYTDNSKKYIGYGILVMEYLAGRYPSYKSSADMNGVMKCLADIHSTSISSDEVVFGEPFGENSVPRDTVKLIAPGSATGAILDECESMLKIFIDSSLGDSSVKIRLRRLLDKGHELAAQSRTDTDATRCCINTELNSTNFLVDDSGYVRLVDWEKPLYGDPAQDIAHLLAPTTTFWKTDIVLSPEEADRLIDEYLEAVDGRYETCGIRERIIFLINITCLRGLTWCAMAWVQYQDPDKLIANESTRKKLDDYLSNGFLSDIEKRFGI